MNKEAAGRYRFAHALIRETLYEALRPSQRARLHRHVGDAIERRSADDEHLSALALAASRTSNASRPQRMLG